MTTLSVIALAKNDARRKIDAAFGEKRPMEYIKRELVVSFLSLVFIQWYAIMGAILFTGGGLARLLNKTKWSARIIMVVGVLAVFAACYAAWADKTVALQEAMDSHPAINLSERPLVQPAAGGLYYNVELRVQTTKITHAIPYLTLLCLLKNGQCDPAFTYDHRRQLGWHEGKDSFLPNTIVGTDWLVLFLVNDKGKRLSVFYSQPDSTFPWGSDLPVGKYKISILVDSAESSLTATYVLDWYGDQSTLSMQPVGK